MNGDLTGWFWTGLIKRIRQDYDAGWERTCRMFGLQVGYTAASVNAHAREPFVISGGLQATAIACERLSEPALLHGEVAGAADCDRATAAPHVPFGPPPTSDAAWAHLLQSVDRVGTPVPDPAVPAWTGIGG